MLACNVSVYFLVKKQQRYSVLESCQRVHLLNLNVIDSSAFDYKPTKLTVILLLTLFQFGSEKDVYGPRFAKNITLTFQHIFRCSAEEQVLILHTVKCNLQMVAKK